MEREIVGRRLYRMAKNPTIRAEGLSRGVHDLIAHTGTALIPTIVGLQEHHTSPIAERLGLKDLRNFYGLNRRTMNNLLIPHDWRVSKLLPFKVFDAATSYPDCYNFLSAILQNLQGKEVLVSVAHLDDGLNVEKRSKELQEVAKTITEISEQHGIPAVLIADGNQITKYDINTQKERLRALGLVNVVGTEVPTCDETANEWPGLGFIRSVLASAEPVITRIAGQESNDRTQLGSMAIDLILTNPVSVRSIQAGVGQTMPPGFTDHKPTFALLEW
jgi:glutaredoxin-related protein